MVFDPISALIIGAIGAAAIFTIVYYAYLTWLILVTWFQEYKYLVNNGDNVAFTLQERMASGQYKTIQGIFDLNSQEVVESRKIQSDNVDSRIQNAHENGREPLVVWQ